MSDIKKLADQIYNGIRGNFYSKSDVEKMIEELVSVDRDILHRAYKSWKQGATKGMAWADLEEVFLEYERIHPEKRSRFNGDAILS